MLILINIVFGFAVPGIDNAAHIGGLIAGFVLGVLVPPHGVQTLSTLWQQPDTAGTAHVARVPSGIIFVALAPIAIAVIVVTPGGHRDARLTSRTSELAEHHLRPGFTVRAAVRLEGDHRRGARRPGRRRTAR